MRRHRNRFTVFCISTFLFANGCRPPSAQNNAPPEFSEVEMGFLTEAVNYARQNSPQPPSEYAASVLEGAKAAVNAIRQGDPIFLRPLWVMVEGAAYKREMEGEGPWFPKTEGQTTIIRKIPTTGHLDFPFDDLTGLQYQLPNDNWGDGFDQGWNLTLSRLAEHGIFASNSTKRKKP